jgi:predicted RNA-binding protein associated with RNAse of E/G family
VGSTISLKQLLCRDFHLSASAENVSSSCSCTRPARSFGYFWFDRPYNVYHWLHAGATLGYYINIGRFRSLSDSELVWDDYAVDILAFPDGTVEVLDEDEVPETIDPPIREFITEAKSRVLAELDAIIDSVERETRSLDSKLPRGQGKASVCSCRSA